MTENTTKTKLPYNGGYIFFEQPTKCPECSSHVTPDVVSFEVKPYNQINCALAIFKCTNQRCESNFSAFYLKYSNTNSYLLKSVYPSITEYSFDDCIVNLSPRFVELYNQAYAAEQLGHYDLSITGYRNALEVLLKDYVIAYIDGNRGKIAKLHLHKVIDLLDSAPLQNSADVIRVIGNDKTHYDQKYEELEYSKFKKYLAAIIQFIDYSTFGLEQVEKKST